MTELREPENYDHQAVLADLLRQDAIPMDELHRRYGSLLELVRILIGVVPNCDPYLEIWKPAFRTYNIMVPNFLNLPFSVFGLGGARKDLVGLGMYVASRAAECPYCSAHTCSFALRRGASPETVAQALVGGDNFSKEELATIAVARSLARIPCELTSTERNNLEALFTPQQAEWIVMGAVMMGFLNKFMDTISVELEASAVEETRATMGADWDPGKAGRDLDQDSTIGTPPSRDSLWTKLSVIPHLPGAIRLDKQWLKGVPKSWPQVGQFLSEISGHDFPVLSKMHSSRAIRAVAAMLRENLNPQTTVIGIPAKVLAGMIFAKVVEDETLANDINQLAASHSVSDAHLQAAARFAVETGADLPAEFDDQLRALLSLARAASPSPAEIIAEVIEDCRQQALAPAAIVELVTWISVLQMLHRLSSYHCVDQQ